MPNHIKTTISIIALLTAVIFAYVQNAAGQSDVAWVAVGTGIFAVFAMWIFPDAEKKPK